MPRKSTKPQPRSRGQIIEEGDGKYRVRVFTGIGANGKREYVSKLVTGTISQAQKARTAMLTGRDTHTLSRPTGERLSAFLPRFLKDVKLNAVQPGTYRGYCIQANTHILPALGHIKVEALSPERVQAWIGELVGKGLSYASVRHAYVVLEMAMEQAVIWNIIVRNPCSHIELPSNLKSLKREMQTFTVDELHRFLAGIPQLDQRYQRYLPLAHFLLTCGLRPSEAAALRWSDLDDAAGTVTVRRALAQQTAGTWVVRESTKTIAGMRTLAVPESTLALLRQLRTSQLRERMAVGPKWQAGDYIFTTRQGHTLQPNNMSRIWKAMCKLTNVPAIRLYDARHTATTMELAGGVDPKTISKRRGHASVAFTLNQYGHVLNSMDSAAAAAVDAIFTPTSAKVSLAR